MSLLIVAHDSSRLLLHGVGETIPTLFHVSGGFWGGSLALFWLWYLCKHSLLICHHKSQVMAHAHMSHLIYIKCFLARQVYLRMKGTPMKEHHTNGTTCSLIAFILRRVIASKALAPSAVDFSAKSRRAADALWTSNGRVSMWGAIAKVLLLVL